jgi:thiol:disulfide interchange protein DsbD
MVRFGLSTLVAPVALTLVPVAFAQTGDPIELATAIQPSAVTASLVADKTAVLPGKLFTVAVKLDVPKGYYTYYKSPGSIGLPTKVTISAPPGFSVGPIQFPGPEVKHEDLGGKPVANFLYRRTTHVIARVKPPSSLTPGETVNLTATASFQYCQDSGTCFPPKLHQLSLSLPVAANEADVRPSASAAAIASVLQSLPSPGKESKYATVRAVLNQDKIRPGDKAVLGIVVDIEPDHKLQMHRPPLEGLVSTELILEETSGIEPWPQPTYPPPMPPKEIVAGFEKVYEYRDRFVITVPVKASESLSGTDVRFSGLLHYQACTTAGLCYPARFAAFELSVPVVSKGSSVSRTHADIFDSKARGSADSPATQPVQLGAGDSKTSGDDRGGDLTKLSYVDSDGAGESLALYVLYAFLGGLILNVMPCVLPVIAIKVLGFARQAGESRSRILLLNAAYSAGVVAVFLALATLAVVLGFGWGQLFQSANFNMVMAAVVFAMGLSLLGVFEIPVPGFVGSAAGSTHREGPVAAFLTGVLATLLATPCSGPFLGVTLGWSVRQPPGVTYLIWATMGLGMASPYLVIGFFPRAIRLLPKPGEWMVTFKELAGLVLMGTVLYIISFIDSTYILPTLVLLLGLGLGFWMIGQLYDHNSSAKRKLVVRSLALLSSGAICVFGLTYVKHVAEWRQARDDAKRRQQFVEELDTEFAGQLARPISSLLADRMAGRTGEAPAGEELDWKPFSENLLRNLLEQRKTVLIDFTADWCLTCKLNETVALNTSGTRELVRSLGAITLVADYTDRSPEIKLWLDKFDSISVPLTVIFPGDSPERPIVLRDAYTENVLHEKLKAAGASNGARLQAARN